MFKKIYLLALLAISCLFSCNNMNTGIKPAIESIISDDMKTYISVLASDDFEGRAPATKGEEKTINYLAQQFKQIGLEPANNGSYFQEVDLVKIRTNKASDLIFSSGKSKVNLKFPDDYAGGTPQLSENIKIDGSDVIFVGYGINSPENNWNDYAGTDVKGKTVIMLVNDPGYATGDTSLFTGKAMTYYGRWTYKFEEAARQGARAAIIIHETGAAAYPWGVVQNNWTGDKFYLADNDLSRSELQLQSWMTTESAKKIFESAGLDYDKQIKSAAQRGFKPVAMNLKASVELNNKIEHTKSNNVVALWPGTDRSDECIIYSAHWDHFGINPAFKGDSILNGAVDNATGTAALLEIAKAFTKLPEKQRRSVLFLSPTCEEQGLLGSEFYVEHPLFPLAKTAAVINMDALNILGRTKDLTISGYGNSQLDNYVVDVLKKYGRYAIPDPTPEKGGYFRSDHFSFARAGVPSTNLSQGIDNIEHGKEWALATADKWISENYHKPSDNYEPDKWNFDGMIDDIRIYFEAGYNITITDKFPEWSPSFTFKSLRDKMMKQ